MLKALRISSLGLAAGISATVALAAAAGIASSAKDFYQGKALTIIVPAAPGGGYDLWPRLMAPYLRQYLGVADVKVQNMPGGGGLVGTNAIYASAPDGLTIGDTNAAGDVFAQTAKTPGVEFDTVKFNWIGRPDNDPHIIAVHPQSHYETFDDIIALKGAITVLHCLAAGKGSSDYNSAVMTMNAFGVPFDMVAAFNGSHEEKEIFLAGDGDTISVSASDIAEVGPNEARVLVLTARQPFDKLPGVPTVIEEAKKHRLPMQTITALETMAAIMDMGHGFFAPPGVPPDRLDALRSSFAKMFQNKDFVSKAEKAGLYVGYQPPTMLEQASQIAFKHTAELAALLKIK